MFSRTWWGQRFLAALERFTDSGRLGRGRTYARTGRVLSYELKGNTVTAKVRGSINPYFGIYKEPIYTTRVSMTAISQGEWTRVLADISSRAGFVARLLMKEMPETIDDAFAEVGVHLLPHDRDDLVTTCSCPDWGNPCKHIAAVYSLLASDLDHDPFLLFELRGLSRDSLRVQLEASPLGRILSAEMTPRDVPVEPAGSYYTRPERETPREMGLREFWMGAKRLPPFEPQERLPRLPALLVRRQGDYPAFWPKEASFVAVMEELYERVRSKSPELK